MAGKVSEREICGEMVQIYAGLREQELREAAARFVHEFVPQRIFAQMAALVATLAQSGAEIWAVSSTNKWVVAEGVRAFGIPEERILAADARIENGLISSEIADVPTDEGKAASLARAGLAHPDAAFGNSIHDLAMLKAARNAFPVNPSPALAEAAAKNGWGCFWPREAESVQAAVPGKSS
jgi:phosphoserine phosphatase